MDAVPITMPLGRGGLYREDFWAATMGARTYGMIYVFGPLQARVRKLPENKLKMGLLFV